MGQIYFEGGNFNAEISQSTLKHNDGMTGEADLRIEAASHVKLHTVIFQNFTSNSELSGLSTTISQKVPFTFEVQMESVAYYWKMEEMSDEALKIKVSDQGNGFSKKSAIVLDPGNLNTKYCTFTRWYEAYKGGVLHVGPHSVSQLANTI